MGVELLNWEDAASAFSTTPSLNVEIFFSLSFFPYKLSKSTHSIFDASSLALPLDLCVKVVQAGLSSPV